MIEKTCCFKGHRKISQNNIERIVKRLNEEVDNLINQGVTDFISGGAIGFDLIAASLIVYKKEQGNPTRLILALPCRNHDTYWPEQEKCLLHDLLPEAVEVVFVSDKYSDNCMKLRNQYMVNRSAYCLCALTHQNSGTGQTVNYARKKGLIIVNLADYYPI